MIKKTLLSALLFVFIPAYPSLAGCTLVTHYAEANDSGQWKLVGGVTSLPTLPGPNEFVVMIYNEPSFVTVESIEVITAKQMAAECNISVTDLKVLIPPDCNAQPITILGDPNTLYYKRITLNYTKAKVGTYTFQARVMGLNTIEVDIKAIVNPKQTNFFVIPCK